MTVWCRNLWQNMYLNGMSSKFLQMESWGQRLGIILKKQMHPTKIYVYIIKEAIQSVILFHNSCHIKGIPTVTWSKIYVKAESSPTILKYSYSSNVNISQKSREESTKWVQGFWLSLHLMTFVTQSPVQSVEWRKQEKHWLQMYTIH